MDIVLGFYWGYIGNNGKENGNYYNGLYKGLYWGSMTMVFNNPSLDSSQELRRSLLCGLRLSPPIHVLPSEDCHG